MANNKTPTSNPKGTTDIRKMTDAELQQEFGEMIRNASTLTYIYNKYLYLGFNFFSVSHMARWEIKHSRVLSWFLRPTENPGAGGYILKELLAQIGWNNLSEPDCRTFTVVNEEYDIDILIYSEDKNKVVVIENKIDAAERIDGDDGGQLEKYHNYIKNSHKYKDCESRFIFLSPDGRKPSAKNIGEWQTLNYSEIKDVIEEGWKNAKKADKYPGKPEPDIISEIDILEKHYIKLIERSIAMTKKEGFRADCVEFYKNHRAVLDAMFEIVQDVPRQINDFIQEELKNNQELGLEWDEQINTNTSRYFTTQFLRTIANKRPGKKAAECADCIYEFLTTKDGSVLKCTIFNTGNTKAMALRKFNNPKSKDTNSSVVSFQIINGSVCKKEIIDKWLLSDEEDAKKAIRKGLIEAMEGLKRFEQEAQNFFNKNS